MFISNNGTEQLVAVLCSSKSNTAATKLKEHESCSEASTPTKKESKEEQEPENNLETINVWELLAGLDDDSEAAVEKNEEPYSFEALTAVEKANDGVGAKGLKRKAAAKDLARMKAPAFEFSRSGSLRDWLSQGGQLFSPGSYATPRFGSLEPAAASEAAEGKEENFFDPNIVSQLEGDMEEMAMEEERILRQIEHNPEGEEREVH